MTSILAHNLLSPLALAFALGVFSKLIRSEFEMPKDLHQSLAIYLLLALGLKGGVELSHTTFHDIFRPSLATIALGIVTPLSAYLILRRAGKFGIADSAGIAAHYGSVSAVTFIACQQFVEAQGHPAENYMPTLLTLMESPGIHIALALGAIQLARQKSLKPAPDPTGAGSSAMMEPRPQGAADDWKDAVRHVLTARTMVLLVGGLFVGLLMGNDGWKPVAPFFETGFKGALTLFLLDMGLVAGERFRDLGKVGPFLLIFGVLTPLLHGALGVALGHWAGMSVGGCTVLGAMAASASYIAAPPAVRMTLPEANPTLYLTLALGITFPFNILVGIPIYFEMSKWMRG